MSFWNSTKKTVSKAGSGLRGGIVGGSGGALASSDPEFNEQEQRYRNLERRAMRLLQETKDYRGSIAGMTTAQRALATNLTAFLLDVQRPQDYQAAYRQAATNIDQTSQVQFDEVYVHTVLEPMAQYCGYLPEFNKAIKKRKALHDDLEKARKTLAKEQGKAAEDPMGVERAEQDVQYAESAYNALNAALIREIPKLINSRVYVVDPCFEAFVKSQLQFFKDSLQQMDSVTRFVPSQDGSGASDDDRILNERVVGVMNQVRGLRICSFNM
ncbi:BAR adaptor protein Hob3 [Coemansia thaxteri]|uniref:BAR adaptor protein Hob3 n=1 Tax=Coemansia thaxteri TaxID=2663907 RepID=A0A9W8BIX2_9FUNG|nr:BAR adaptor protein Hob3 [Coemansia thaxteri]KAJ2009823.1 BAR adaptor protein Hob3 [Coemansia thaxteri]KAJ2470089.1 BAR adaptor protein Hob3 [Coemansia sp. RSA 2322]KAJ2486204.1 BAR adaptor protein Hob3 [Coemansia sp. RSA 2320]